MIKKNLFHQKFCRYRYKHTATILSISLLFVDIDTSTLWRYRGYRYDVDTYFDDIVDIDQVLSTSILAHCDDIVDIVDIVTISTDFVDIDTFPQ